MGAARATRLAVLLSVAAVMGCDDPLPASMGIVRVRIATTGVDPDPDGYTLVIAGATYQLPTNANSDITGLPVGEFVAVLDGVDPNCSASPTTVRVTVHRRIPTTVAFSVTCVSRVGRLQVTTSTSGDEVDPDGYRVRVDGGPERAIAVTGTVVIDDVHGGSRQVQLRHVARNCTVAPGLEQQVNVPFGGGTAGVTFVITCVTSGRLEVTAPSTGSDLDVNGYDVGIHRADLDTTVSLSTTGSARITTLFPGDYEVRLLGVAANCDVTPPNPRTIAVVGGVTTNVAFSIACAALTRLAVVKITNDNADIWTINSNGTTAVRLMSHEAADVEPAWSRDGSKIAFSRVARDGASADVYVMNSDGSGVTRVTQDADAVAGQPTWSPDGSKIAFQSDRDGDGEIYVINADGSGLTRLTNNETWDGDPAWSPDGQQIAFSSDRNGNREIYVMNADGSAATRLTTNVTDDVQPAWSPDGSKLAFAKVVSCGYYGYGCDHDLYVMTMNGLTVTQLTSGPESHTEPTWSPDGGKLAFTAVACNGYYCYDSSTAVKAVKADGSNLAEVANGSARSPAWRW